MVTAFSPTEGTNIFPGHEDRVARAVEFDSDLYRQRKIAERLIGWLKEFRRIFARCENLS